MLLQEVPSLPITCLLYSPEFRQQLIDLARAGRDPVSLSKEFEPTAETIRKWVAAAGRHEGSREKGGAQAVAGDGLSAAERDELARLRRENKQRAAKDAAAAGTTQAIGTNRMRGSAGKAGAVATTFGTRKHAGAVEVLAKLRHVPAGGNAGSFRGKAFRTLLLHDPVVARAVAELVVRGAVTGTRSKKVSTRVDPGLMAAAKQRFGLASEADIINSSLAVAAAPDRFKDWLRNPQHTLTDDFELAV